MKGTYLIDDFKRKRKKNTEIIRQENIKKVKEALGELSQRIPFKSAYLFGSILKPHFSANSDIDIAFEVLRDEDFFKAMAFLSDCLDRDVDIIQIERHRLKDKVYKEGILIDYQKVGQTYLSGKSKVKKLKNKN